MLYHKANLAAKQNKGNYLKNYVIYNEEMSRKIEAEQEIINEMSWALSHGEFQIYLQPKYNLSTNKPEGAEALVRWMHPRKGMPGVFIPIFERNGFISQLDYYVWEHVCILLRKWLDEGKAPLPISVNVSRVNIYTPNLVEKLCLLIEKYDIPIGLFQLELTENSYIDYPQIMMETIKNLQRQGFVILMDDFGSGYSSLNILKDVEVNILKLDMKFLSDTRIPGRGENILSSVVRMAKWLSIPVIAEGVEKPEQVEFLRGIGCEYVQGYYFAMPMCIDEYEKLAQSNITFQAPPKKQFNADELWVSNPQMEMLFTNVLQAIAIYEFHDDYLEPLRVNKAFHDLFGYEDTSRGNRNPLDMVKSEYRSFVLNAFRQAVSDDISECDYQRRMKDERKMWIHLKLKYIKHPVWIPHNWRGFPSILHLRVLEGRKVRPLGSNKETVIDIRFISSINENPEEAIQNGHMRADFFYRLAVLQVKIPSLKERQEDIPELVDFFIQLFNEKMNRYVTGIREESMKLLLNYDWPGNVRQLKACIESAMNFARDHTRITPEDLPDYVKGRVSGELVRVNPAMITSGSLRNDVLKSESGNVSSLSLSDNSSISSIKQKKMEKDRRLTVEALEENNWNVAKTARAMGISRQMLYKRIKKYNIG